MSKENHIFRFNEKEYYTLLSWSKIHDVNYNGYKKKFQRGLLPQGYQEEGSIRIYIETNYIPPKAVKMMCMCCNTEVNQITNTYLNLCSPGLTLTEYVKEYGFLVFTTDRGLNGKYPEGYARTSEKIYTSMTNWHIKYARNLSTTKDKLLNNEIPGFYDPVTKLYWIDNNYEPELIDKVQCKLCDNYFESITQTHLDKCHDGIIMESYKFEYPDEKIVNDITSVKISNFHTGREKTAEEIAKNVASLEIYWSTHEHSQKGIPRTEEVKEKISKSSIGKVISQETRDKISKSTIGVPKPEGHGDKVSESIIARFYREANDGTKKKVKTRDTNPEKEFEAMLDAMNIKYEKQFPLGPVPGEKGRKRTCDFYLSEYNILIEIDGPHHWSGWSYGMFGKSDAEKTQAFENTKNKDAETNFRAIMNGYKIYRIEVKNKLNDVKNFKLQLEEQNFPHLELFENKYT